MDSRRDFLDIKRLPEGADTAGRAAANRSLKALPFRAKKTDFRK